MSTLVQAWLVVAGCGSGLVGFCVGAWRGERHDDRMRAEGYEEACDDLLAQTADMASVRTVSQAGVGGPDSAPRVEGPPAVPAADAQPALRAGDVAARGYGPYLAAIGRDDPAGWYANLTAGEPPPEPGPAPEAAWLERQLYEGAVWSARLESWGSRFTDAFHADVAAWDRMAARWQEQAWFMVESRRWPPKMLEAV